MNYVDSNFPIHFFCADFLIDMILKFIMHLVVETEKKLDKLLQIEHIFFARVHSVILSGSRKNATFIHT